MEEEEEEEEQKGPDLKQASRRDMYSICQSAGLGVYILYLFFFEKGKEKKEKFPDPLGFLTFLN